MQSGAVWAEERTPVLVELFTSEGCSSCPAADRLLAQLQHLQPVDGAEIVALSEHVDYWNDLGWTDPYSSETFTHRQSVYATGFDRSSVYTPQMIVDGATEFVGGDRRSAVRAIRRATKVRKARVALKMLQGDPASNETGAIVQFEIEITGLPRIDHSGRSDLFLAMTEDNLSADVPTGENAGRSLDHSCVVRLLHPIEEIKGSPRRVLVTTPAVRLPEDWKVEDLRAIAFLQDRSSHRVLGVASLRLPSDHQPERPAEPAGNHADRQRDQIGDVEAADR